MVEHFAYDVFLSHSPKDKAVAREIAERLRTDGLDVYVDEWNGSSQDIDARIEEGLERSRVLVLCMSINAFEGDWPSLERQTLRFRDPVNTERRFVLVRLDEAPIPSSLAQMPYVVWTSSDDAMEHEEILEVCRRPEVEWTAGDDKPDSFQHKVRLSVPDVVHAYAFTPDGKYAVTAGERHVIRLWELPAGRLIRELHGHFSSIVRSVAINHAGDRMVSSGTDGIVHLWDMNTGRFLRTFEPANTELRGLSWSPDGRRVLSATADTSVSAWDSNSGHRITSLRVEAEAYRTRWSKTFEGALATCLNGTIWLWDFDNRKHFKLIGHKKLVYDAQWNADESLIVSCSADTTVRIWDAKTCRCLRILEGSRSEVRWVSWSADEQFVVAISSDATLSFWHLASGRYVRVLRNFDFDALCPDSTLTTDGRFAFAGSADGTVSRWDLSGLLSASQQVGSPAESTHQISDQIQYTNAKVLLVGESGVGKTGLSKVLAGEGWQPSDSTVGAWATQWKLPVKSEKGVEREIWLWDFGGQADQRLIHQLYMDETALAVLVFDGQKEDLFDTLGQWDRDLTRASRKDFAKLLVAGRVDAGGLRVSRKEIDSFAAERKFGGFLETSAKTSHGCDELKDAILNGINWDDIPCRTTEVLFKKLKEEIIRLKDEGRVLLRFKELRDALQLRLSSEYKQFTDNELRAVITLLAGPGVVWELAFGSWILLQPERINAYAQAVIRTLQADEHQRGCLMEEQVLKGDLIYESSMSRLTADEERFVLLAMHQTLVERGLCLRQPTDKGNLLVFPSYYRRERPELVKFPAVLVNYRFTGFLDEIYATLIVRLHHSEAFDQDRLWRYAADFKTQTGKQLGVRLNRRAQGVGELEVYFDQSVAMEEKIIFSKYVHEHLLHHAREVERLRHYVCQQCGTPVGNREVAMQRLNEWLKGRPPESETPKRFTFRKQKDTPTIICVGCERRVPLWDEMERSFASAEIQQRVRDMQEEATIVLSNQSKERALVGEVISTVALANQISRELTVSDHGIDMEIEFTDENQEATGAKVYLQLKSGDSYLYKRKQDGTEVFTIKNERHARYWMAQGFPVLLVIRNSEGEVRWMEIRDWLKRESANGTKSVKQILFDGERFDVMSVRRWRDRCLSIWTP